MDFYVPTVGDKIYLKEDWTFTLYQEYRNSDMGHRLGMEREPSRYYYRGDQAYNTPVTLPAKTALVIDRIYIRKGQTEFDSITFRIESCSDDRLAYMNSEGKKIRGKKQSRFWVKLRDANRIKCELEPIADREAPAALSRFRDI